MPRTRFYLFVSSAAELSRWTGAGQPSPEDATMVHVSVLGDRVRFEVANPAEVVMTLHSAIAAGRPADV